jgi:kynureninase
MKSRTDCLALDAADPLASLRQHFALPEGVVYLDGNSLGALPKQTPARLAEVMTDEWGEGLIRSWNTAGWIDLPQRVGDRIARLVGVGPGELTVADSTSVNLYKVLSAALTIVAADAPQRRVIVSERGNFPTDLYIADSVARQHGCELKLVEADEIPAQLDDRLAVLMLTHVDYRSGRMHRMAETTRAAHDAGALMVWDLAHSAGAVPVALTHAGSSNDPTTNAPHPEDADFAIGCGYKYLNGGPGAPAFAWAHPRHTARMDANGWRQPLSGWLGHAAPFEFVPDYHPATGIQRFVCGTPPVLSLAALECGLAVFDLAEAFGGMTALRAKSSALCDLFIEQVEARCPGLKLVTPRAAAERGSQVSFAAPEGGYATMQALIARGVIGDFRAPDILRFGFTPLYTRFVDAFDAAVHLAAVLEHGEWREARFQTRAAVT